MASGGCAPLRLLAGSINPRQALSGWAIAADLIAPPLGPVPLAAVDRGGGASSLESWSRFDAKRDGHSMGGATNSPCLAVQECVDLLRTKGLGTIPKDERLFFLVNDGIARFVRFEEQPAKVIGKAHKRKEKPPPKVFVHWMTSEKFEQALESGTLEVFEEQIKLPPWRAALQDRDVVAHDRARSSKGKTVKFSHEAALNKKLAAMSPITENLREFLLSEDPVGYVKALARSATPAINEGIVTDAHPESMPHGARASVFAPDRTR